MFETGFNFGCWTGAGILTAIKNGFNGTKNLHCGGGGGKRERMMMVVVVLVVVVVVVAAFLDWSARERRMDGELKRELSS